MPKFRHVNPLGACEVPLLGRVLEAGEVFDATPAQAEQLREQPSNYAPVKAAKKTAAPRKPRAAKKTASAAQVVESTTEKEGA